MTTATPAPANLLIRRIVIELTVMTVIGVFLALIGPFGTIDAPLGVRLVMWLAFAYIGYVFYRPMQNVVAWGERTLDLPRWGLWIAACLASTAPMTLAVIAIGSWPGPLVWPSLDQIMGTYFSVLVIGAAVTVLFNWAKPGQRGSEPDPAPLAASPPVAPWQEPAAPPPSNPPSNALLAQLPPELGSDIIALEMEDHYVRVHTALGSALVLMRLRDALVLVGGQEGMQVHRSWWVARGAVEDVVRDGRNIRLRLARGIEAPVARAKIANLRDARWI